MTPGGCHSPHDPFCDGPDTPARKTSVFDTGGFGVAVLFWFVVILCCGVGVVTCSRDVEEMHAAATAAIRDAGYVPVEVPRSFRTEDGVRSVRAWVVRDGAALQVVVSSDHDGPWLVSEVRKP